MALALLAFVLVARAVPEDPNALSLDNIERTIRMAEERDLTHAKLLGRGP